MQGKIAASTFAGHYLENVRNITTVLRIRWQIFIWELKWIERCLGEKEDPFLNAGTQWIELPIYLNNLFDVWTDIIF